MDLIDCEQLQNDVRVFSLSIGQYLEEANIAISEERSHRMTIFQRDYFSMKNAKRAGMLQTSVTKESVTDVKKLHDDKDESHTAIL